MELGQLVDYIIEWNDAHDQGRKTRGKKREKEKPKRRAATQADIDAFWG